MTIDRVIFVATAAATHGIVGYVLVTAFTDVDPRLGFCLAVVPDLDLLFPAAWGLPFVHRGITHAPAAAAAVTAIAYAISRRRDVALAVGLSLGSHLLIDSLSPAGIPLAFPFAADSVTSPGIAVHGLRGTVLIWLVAVALFVVAADE